LALLLLIASLCIVDRASHGITVASPRRTYR